MNVSIVRDAIAITTSDTKVSLVKQYRHGAPMFLVEKQKIGEYKTREYTLLTDALRALVGHLEGLLEGLK